MNLLEVQIMIRMLASAFMVSISFASMVFSQDSARAITALIRCDDAGMCHAVNVAIREIAESGIPFSASVMVPCPWFQEAVEILNAYPHVSAGIHLTLNSEWRNYRWGPTAGAETVPSLVDSAGYFFPSRASFFANHPKLEEVEQELRSQIKRAQHSGLTFDYVDYHMGTAVDTPELRALVERLAQEYGLGISRYFGEQDVEGVYKAPVQDKTDTLVSRVRELIPGAIRLFVFHTGMESPEMDALVDMNSFGLPDVSKHRNAERKALLSSEFRTALSEKGVNLITYRDLIERIGLQRMKRPE